MISDVIIRCRLFLHYCDIDIIFRSDIPVLKIISVLVSIKFGLNHFSISFYTVSELFSVLVSIKFS